MRKTIFMILTLMVVSVSFGQTEKSENKIVAENFIEKYNNNDYKAIFSMFAEVMQKALPLDKTTEYLTGLKAQAGKYHY